MNPNVHRVVDVYVSTERHHGGKSEKEIANFFTPFFYICEELFFLKWGGMWRLFPSQSQ